jgi:hypothetical protein
MKETDNLSKVIRVWDRTRNSSHCCRYLSRASGWLMTLQLTDAKLAPNTTLLTRVMYYG